MKAAGERIHVLTSEVVRICQELTTWLCCRHYKTAFLRNKLTVLIESKLSDRGATNSSSLPLLKASSISFGRVLGVRCTPASGVKLLCWPIVCEYVGVGDEDTLAIGSAPYMCARMGCDPDGVIVNEARLRFRLPRVSPAKYSCMVSYKIQGLSIRIFRNQLHIMWWLCGR